VRRPSLLLGSLAVAVVISACGIDHGPAGLQKIADEASEERFDNGFAVVVTDREGNRTEGVAGTLVDGTSMSAEDPWVIGSVSKAFVATTVMQLVDEGVLALDDYAAEYVDHEFIPNAATVFDLLHHSSGIPDYLTDEWTTLMKSCPAREPDPYEYVDTTPLFEPGKEWSYANVNYLLLGEVVEAVTGNPIEAEMRSRILDPLDLDATYVLHVETGPPPMAAGQDFYDTGPGPLSDCQMEWRGGPAPVDGFMVSSVRDLDAFYRALFGGELVSEASLDAMMSQDYVGAEHGQGLGLIHLLEPPVDDVDIYANGGGVVGYKTLLMIDLNTMTTIVAVSPGGFAFENQQDDILRWAFGHER
jgi:CubicO group peptidase (beta-lactamase class C family)